MRQRRLARTGQFWKLIAAWHRRSKSPWKHGKRPDHAFLPDGNQFPDTLSRSPFPAGRPIGWIDNSNMGLPSVRRKHANGDPMRPAEGLIPSPAIPPRLINLAGFDKKSVSRLSGY
jgi:hypothetical protein